MSLADLIPNREEIEPGTSTYELAPDGTYTAHVVKAELVTTHAGGSMLKVVHELLDAPYIGKPIFTNFNIVNANKVAEEIGLATLTKLSRACGLPCIPAEEAELLSIPHMIKIKRVEGRGVNPKTGEPYGPQSKIMDYFAAGSTGKAVAERKPLVIAKESLITDEDQPDWMKI